MSLTLADSGAGAGVVSTAEVAQSQHRFTVLDSWRGIAALCVALYHLSLYSDCYFSAFIRNAYLFVDFFFVLSGFVISYTYAARLTDFDSFRVFIIRRFGRLWPLHAAVLAVLFGFELLKLVAVQRHWMVFNEVPFDPHGSRNWASLPTNLLLIQSLGLHDRLTWNGASWSICTEFWAYCVFGLLCCLGRRWLVVGAIVLPILGFAIVLLFSKEHMNVGYDYGVFRCLYGFFIGYLIYRLWRWKPAPAWIGFCELPVIAAAIAFIVFGGTNTVSDFAPLMFGAVVFVFASERGAISRLLKQPAATYLGQHSYSIYMVHGIITDFMNYAAVGFGKILHRSFMMSLEGARVPLITLGDHLYVADLVVPFYLAVVIAISAVTYRLIEQPGRRFFNDLAGRPNRLPDRVSVSREAGGS